MAVIDSLLVVVPPPVPLPEPPPLPDPLLFGTGDFEHDARVIMATAHAPIKSVFIIVTINGFYLLNAVNGFHEFLALLFIKAFTEAGILLAVNDYTENALLLEDLHLVFRKVELKRDVFELRF